MQLLQNSGEFDGATKRQDRFRDGDVLPYLREQDAYLRQYVGDLGLAALCCGV